AAARIRLEESLVTYRALGDKRGGARSLTGMAAAATCLGGYDTAKAFGEAGGRSRLRGGTTTGGRGGGDAPGDRRGGRGEGRRGRPGGSPVTLGGVAGDLSRRGGLGVHRPRPGRPGGGEPPSPGDLARPGAAPGVSRDRAGLERPPRRDAWAGERIRARVEPG